MAIELITGRAGRAHVDSSDVRAFNAYVNAGGRYVLHGGGATMESANDLHILPAEILMDGAHVRITGTGEEVTLENGASSYDRIDIVALHYTSVGSDDSRVESVTLEVIKGTPVDTGGEAQDPAMPVPGTSILNGSSEVYVPYIRVKITGLVPGDPEELLPGRVQMLRDMIAGLTLSDVSGTLPVDKGGTGATTAAGALENLGVYAECGELLWNGLIAKGGTLTIPRANEYGVMAVSYANHAPVGLAMHFITYLGQHYISGWAGSATTGGLDSRGFSFLSDDGVTWTLYDAYVLSTWGSGTAVQQEAKDVTVTNSLTIWGVVPSDITQRVLIT